MSSDLSDLITRLEAATEGTADLDEEICTAVLPPPGGAFSRNYNAYWDAVKSEPTASLDAATALVGRVRGPMWSISYNGAGYTAEMQDWPSFVSRGQTPPLAMCAALLRTLQAQGDGNG